MLVAYNTRNLLKCHYIMYISFASVRLLTGSFDPCTTYNILEHSKYRGGNCTSKPGKELCDKYMDEQWYKTENNLTISSTIQNQYHCGTSFPIWLNGKLKTYLSCNEKTKWIIASNNFNLIQCKQFLYY